MTRDYRKEEDLKKYENMENIFIIRNYWLGKGEFSHRQNQYNEVFATLNDLEKLEWKIDYFDRGQKNNRFEREYFGVYLNDIVVWGLEKIVPIPERLKNLISEQTFNLNQQNRGIQEISKELNDLLKSSIHFSSDVTQQFRQRMIIDAIERISVNDPELKKIFEPSVQYFHTYKDIFLTAGVDNYYDYRKEQIRQSLKKNTQHTDIPFTKKIMNTLNKSTNDLLKDLPDNIKKQWASLLKYSSHSVVGDSKESIDGNIPITLISTLAQLLIAEELKSNKPHLKSDFLAEMNTDKIKDYHLNTIIDKLFPKFTAAQKKVLKTSALTTLDIQNANLKATGFEINDEKLMDESVHFAHQLIGELKNDPHMRNNNIDQIQKLYEQLMNGQGEMNNAIRESFEMMNMVSVEGFEFNENVSRARQDYDRQAQNYEKALKLRKEGKLTQAEIEILHANLRSAANLVNSKKYDVENTRFKIEVGRQTAQLGINALSMIFKHSGNPEAARAISAIGGSMIEAGIAIAGLVTMSINPVMGCLALGGSLLSMLDSILSGFGGKSEFQLISEQLGQISKQLSYLSENLEILHIKVHYLHRDMLRNFAQLAHELNRIEQLELHQYQYLTEFRHEVNLWLNELYKQEFQKSAWLSINHQNMFALKPDDYKKYIQELLHWTINSSQNNMLTGEYRNLEVISEINEQLEKGFINSFGLMVKYAIRFGSLPKNSPSSNLAIWGNGLNVYINFLSNVSNNILQDVSLHTNPTDSISWQFDQIITVGNKMKAVVKELCKDAKLFKYLFDMYSASREDVISELEKIGFEYMRGKFKKSLESIETEKMAFKQQSHDYSSMLLEGGMEDDKVNDYNILAANVLRNADLCVQKSHKIEFDIFNEGYGAQNWTNWRRNPKFLVDFSHSRMYEGVLALLEVFEMGSFEYYYIFNQNDPKEQCNKPFDYTHPKICVKNYTIVNFKAVLQLELSRTLLTIKPDAPNIVSENFIMGNVYLRFSVRNFDPKNKLFVLKHLSLYNDLFKRPLFNDLLKTTYKRLLGKVRPHFTQKRNEFRNNIIQQTLRDATHPGTSLFVAIQAFDTYAKLIETYKQYVFGYHSRTLQIDKPFIYDKNDLLRAIKNYEAADKTKHKCILHVVPKIPEALDMMRGAYILVKKIDENWQLFHYHHKLNENAYHLTSIPLESLPKLSEVLFKLPKDVNPEQLRVEDLTTLKQIISTYGTPPHYLMRKERVMIDSMRSNVLTHIEGNAPGPEWPLGSPLLDHLINKAEVAKVKYVAQSNPSFSYTPFNWDTYFSEFDDTREHASSNDNSETKGSPKHSEETQSLSLSTWSIIGLTVGAAIVVKKVFDYFNTVQIGIPGAAAESLPAFTAIDQYDPLLSSLPQEVKCEYRALVTVPSGLFSDADHSPYLICESSSYSNFVQLKYSTETKLSLHVDPTKNTHCTMDVYDKSSCRPIEFFGRPSVICEGRTTTMIHTPQLMRNPLEGIDGQLLLARFVIHYLVKSYSNTKPAVNSLEEQAPLNLLDREAAEVKKALLDCEKTLHFTKMKVLYYETGKDDLCWAKWACEDHTNTLSRLKNKLQNNTYITECELRELADDIDYLNQEVLEEVQVRESVQYEQTHQSSKILEHSAENVSRFGIFCDSAKHHSGINAVDIRSLNQTGIHANNIIDLLGQSYER